MLLIVEAEMAAAELIDMRARITERTALDEWAAKQIHVATLVGRLTRSEGGTKA